MGIEIVPHDEKWIGAVRSFNERMYAKGAPEGFYEEPVPQWLPPRRGSTIHREFFLAVEDGEVVRGGFVIKSEEVYIRGHAQAIASYQGPTSEGVIDTRYNFLGLRMIQDMLKRRPRLFGLGMGDWSRPLPRILRGLRWDMHSMPLCLRVTRPYRFLRMNRFLRRSPRLRLASDVSAFTGAGWLGISLLHGWLGRGARVAGLDSQPVAQFAEWADGIWASSHADYDFIGLRTGTALNASFPENQENVTRLRISRGGRDLGWAIVGRKQMAQEPRFGDLVVGSIIDCLAKPEHALDIVSAAFRFLHASDVDIVITNQSHAAWVDACRRAGFLVLKNRRIFAASRQLARLLPEDRSGVSGFHLTNADGDGPIGLC